MQNNKEIMSWLKNTWTKHRDNWITVAEIWGRRILLEWWPPVKQNRNQLLKYSEWVRKEYLTNGINREDKKKLEPWIFERKDLKENSSAIFKWRRETPPKIIEVLRENEKRRGWANNEMIWNRSWKACDWWNPFLCHTWKELRITPGELEESGKILEKRPVG